MGVQTLLGGRRLLVVAGALTAVVHPLMAQQPPSRPWQPGKEFRVTDTAAGTDGYFLVYVPADYDSHERWPVVFYYHGLGGRPDTGCIRRITDGKYCIIVGMSYYAPGMDGYRFLETEDIRIIRHVREAIKKRLSVNDGRLYVAGFSKGGFYCCEMLRLLSDFLAGAVVLGAGSKRLDAGWPKLKGKEVFIGCGEQDQFADMARAAQERLAALGATVTFEQWPEVGHSIGDTAGLRKWIIKQSVNRPHVEQAPGNLDGPSGPNTTPIAGTHDDPKPRSVPWVAGTVILAGFAASGVVLVRRWRRTRPPRAASQSRAEDMEP